MVFLIGRILGSSRSGSGVFGMMLLAGAENSRVSKLIRGSELLYSKSAEGFRSLECKEGVHPAGKFL